MKVLITVVCCVAKCKLCTQGTPLEATFWGRWARELPLAAAVPVLVLPPALGGVLVGLLRAATRFDEQPAVQPAVQAALSSGEAAPYSRSGQAAGQGMGAGRVRALAAPLLRAGAAAVSLGTGASLGPEGPSVDIGRAAARSLAGVLRSKRRRLLPLMAAGSGAGERRQASCGGFVLMQSSSRGCWWWWWGPPLLCFLIFMHLPKALC